MSTLETAIVFTIVLTLVNIHGYRSFESTAIAAIEDCRCGFEEISFQNKDKKLLNEKKIKCHLL